jgi:hypothetical protein
MRPNARPVTEDLNPPRTVAYPRQHNPQVDEIQRREDPEDGVNR